MKKQMKKEELKAIRDWCESVVAVRRAENNALKHTPRGVISLTESQSDRTIQVYSGIENIAHAMKAVLHIDIYSDNTYQKWITYKGIKIMQLEFFVEVAK
ncbi:hypothetical protein HMPREF0373_00653 [Eubacterium ramulus ATCC 29099]|jgi:hypothetical protein|uniref:Uncharacterized protein n=2 Tax=Eubacterium ramulus TaxID=39490 RepID=U2RAH1_EUBRA|nr:hypothetical protein HMPREF0373_00653 [Eubacterium ramulus ATCC 29099]